MLDTSIDPSYRYTHYSIPMIVGQYPWHGNSNVHNYYNMYIMYIVRIILLRRTIAVASIRSLSPENRLSVHDPSRQ